MIPRPSTLTKSGKPRLAIYNRHSLIDGRGQGNMLTPGDERGHMSLGNWPHNVGDQFVAAGLARALDCDEFYTITREATARQFDIVNEECHAIIVVAQNALSPGWFESHLPIEYLKQLKIPLLFFSLGLQFRFGDTLELTDGDVNVLKYLHDHCESSQIRGEITAELLAKYGIHNTRVLGCPSLLWPMSREINIRPPSFENVGFTLTDMGRLPHIHNYQFSIMETLFNQSKQFTVVAQGGEFSLQSYITARDGIHPSLRHDVWVKTNTEDVRKVERLDFQGPIPSGTMMQSYITRFDTAQLERDVRWYYRDLSKPLLDNIVERAFYGSTLSEYIRRARDASLYVGTRLHGNLMAITQGTPSVFAIHDYRMKDMAEFLKLPFIPFEGSHESLDEICQDGAWD